MQTILTKEAPQPAGHYSQAIEHQGIVYVAGQLPIDPKREARYVGSIEEQTEQVLVNLEAILKEADSDKHHVLKVTMYISDINLWDRVNDVYAQFFRDHRPARVVVPTRELHFGFQIEIDAIAAVKGG
jgi:2-iminobutanoate/2-iminopropanoate deaminase